MARDWHNQPPILHRLVRAQARRTPDRIAAVHDDRWITYDELVARSGGWAHRLRGLGVGVGTPVGFCLERSVDLPIIVLAVLEAGGFCIPLEPSDPPRRLEAVIREMRPALILTQGRLRASLPTTDLPVVAVDEEAPGASEAPESAIAGDDPAYVLMTSGSTGVPKGVLVSHAAVAARMFRPDDDLPEEGRCMAIVKTPIGNGPFLGEILAPLLHGCYFAIARPDGHQDIPYLGGLIIEHEVSHIAMTSAVLRAFLQWPDAPHCRSLRAIYCGGEAVTDELRSRCRECLGEVRFVVTYGTTEAGHQLSHECPAGERLDGLRIGHAIAGARVDRFDADLEPTPAGEAGELYLGGPRLATGYLNRPAWTAERFVPHPFPVEPGERLYRSGDLAGLGPSGDLDFKGRADQLVKVRGNRVELLEIETALAECPGIREAVVLARPDGHGDTQLVAYILPEAKPGPATGLIRSRLGERLPTFMVPQGFVMLDALPLTTNGKVDRRALPEWDGRRTGPESAVIPPRSSVEAHLAQIWRDLLRLDRVGVRDDFFEMGGNSILAVTMFARIEEAIGARLPVSSLLRAPTIEGLAQMLEASPLARRGPQLVVIQQGVSAPPLVFLPSLGGDVLYSRSIVRHLDPDQPVHGLEFRPADSDVRSSMSLESIAALHADALCDGESRGPYRLAGHSFSAQLAFETARQLVARGRRVALLAIIDAGPGWRQDRSDGNLALAAAEFLINLCYWVVDDLMRTPPRVLIDQALLKARKLLLAERRSSPGYADGLHGPLKESILSNLEALHNYSPGSYPGQVTLYRARRRPLFHPRRDDLGWAEKAAGGVDVHVLPGNHRSILKEPHVVTLARSLQASLDRSL